MAKRVPSRLIGELHETMHGLYQAGAIDRTTMKNFDKSATAPIEELSPEEIRALREREEASQAVFAWHLNVTTGLVSQWERGLKKPRGASLKLLTIVKHKGLEGIRV